MGTDRKFNCLRKFLAGSSLNDAFPFSLRVTNHMTVSATRDVIKHCEGKVGNDSASNEKYQESFHTSSNHF